MLPRITTVLLLFKIWISVSSRSCPTAGLSGKCPIACPLESSNEKLTDFIPPFLGSISFDPKKYVPFEVGLPVGDVESCFPTIDTVVDDIKITQGLENIAQVMDRATLIRSHVLPDLGSILHSRHQLIV